MTVAVNAEDPVAGILKEKFARVLANPVSERLATPEKFRTLPTVISLSDCSVTTKVPTVKKALFAVYGLYESFAEPPVTSSPSVRIVAKVPV